MSIFPRISNFHRASLVLLLAAFALPAFAADLAVTLSGGQNVAVDATLLKQLPRVAVSATAHGKTARYEGYDLRAVLAAAGLPPVDSLRGKALRQVVVVHAADGYEVVFALAELDPRLGNRPVLLANRQDGAPLPDGDGPWRLVVPSDARPARWVRQVDSIAVATSSTGAGLDSMARGAGDQSCDGSTMDMTRCMEEKAGEADAELVRYLAAAQARIDGALDARPVLAPTQAAWAAYRRAHCGDVYDFWRGGSIRGPAAASCYLEVTRQRIHEIWSAYLTFPDSTPPLLPEPALRPVAPSP